MSAMFYLSISVTNDGLVDKKSFKSRQTAEYLTLGGVFINQSALPEFEILFSDKFEELFI